MKNTLIGLIGTGALALAGCVADAGAGLEGLETESELVTASGKADSAAVAPPEGDHSLVFYVDNQEGLHHWEQWIGGAGLPVLVGGETVRIEAYPERFPSCGIDGEVTAFARGADGAVTEVALHPGANGHAIVALGELTVPEEGSSIEVWLRSKNGACEEWDSAFGENYSFPMRPWRPTLVELRKDAANPFVGGEERSADDEIAIARSGGVLVVDYDGQRLTPCDFPATVERPFGLVNVHRHIQVIVEYDNGHVDRSSGYYDPSVRRMYSVIPEGAHAAQLYVWSEAISDSYSDRFCLQYDSNDGRNFRFRFTD